MFQYKSTKVHRFHERLELQRRMSTKARAAKISLFPPTDTSPSRCFLQLHFVVLASVFCFTNGSPSVLLVMVQYVITDKSLGLQRYSPRLSNSETVVVMGTEGPVHGMLIQCVGESSRKERLSRRDKERQRKTPDAKGTALERVTESAPKLTLDRHVWQWGPPISCRTLPVLFSVQWFGLTHVFYMKPIFC